MLFRTINLYRLYRTNALHCELAIYVKSSINYIKITDFRHASMEVSCVRLSYYNIVIIYRPLSMNLVQTQILYNHLKNVCNTLIC